MAIALLVGRDEEDNKRFEWFIKEWQQALLSLDPNLDIRVWPNIKSKEDIEFALVWRHAIGELKQFPHLKAIASLAAGVDHVLTDPGLVKHIPIVRLLDPYMANDIVQYVVAAVLHHIKRLDQWEENQKICSWERQPPFNFHDHTVGIMGLGYLGNKAAHVLHAVGLKVIGWSNSPKDFPSIQTFHGKSEFVNFLKQTQVLVCMLPLTPETRDILNQDTFSHLPKQSYLINIGRGDHLVEKDLITALDNGTLMGACLDVFRQEPLPSTHPFWSHPRIRVTPHVASITNAATAAPQILDNYRRALAGENLLNRVDLTKGY